jgi:hypothetical protein
MENHIRKVKIANASSSVIHSSVTTKSQSKSSKTKEKRMSLVEIIHAINNALDSKKGPLTTMELAFAKAVNR